MEVTVRDTGTAIPDEVMKRLFEPFFTTKGRGMGIGLLVCRSIVEAHGGDLSVRSEEGKGATISFTLPVAEEGVGDVRAVSGGAG